ncbi:MAG TPA: UDP-N-acetylmuramoyl-L-alanyl-D-glutamate--2,6-diaminopimelate ligase [Acidimicrobiia bacterium]
MEKSKTLDELAEVVGGHVIGNPQVAVSDVTHDSRQAGAGALFVAIEGENHDGHDFAKAAVTTGAAALCVQRALRVEIPQLVVARTRRVAGELASAVHDNPSQSVDVIGVTGTNGKTTVTHYAESILTANQRRAGVMGTMGSLILGEAIPSVRTTPEAPDFQRLLAQMRDRGAEAIAVEVSSHALELDRVRGTRFAVAGFTNLSQDHLDFHGSMDAYRRAKERLFTEYEVDTAVFNIDDPVGNSLSESYDRPQISVGERGDFAADEIGFGDGVTRFRLTAPGFLGQTSAPVLGKFNLSNLLVAMACCFATGLAIEEIVSALSSLGPVSGRFEIVSRSAEPMVIVDYAHTPDGVANVIVAARAMVPGRVIVVVGAGGDRDRAKRAPMGAAASAADLVIITSDNPRSEDPGAIVDEVLEGVTKESISEPDRAVAIAAAISAAAVGDVVLILGKGHETGQEIHGQVRPFDDRLVARAQLNLLSKSANFDSDSGSIGP